MNVNDVLALLQRWQTDVRQVREHVCRVATPRERERWHALWLLARGWSQAQVADALDQDAHTIGGWLEGFRLSGLAGLVFEQTGGSPRSRPGGAGRVEGCRSGTATGRGDRTC